MTATSTHNRIGAHFADSPATTAELPELPKSARERGRLWSDAVFQAVLALKQQLTHVDVGVVAAAANTIIALEQTRMRHGASVAGSEAESEAQLQFEAEELAEREARAKRRAETAAPTPTVAPRSNGQASAEHAREASAAFENDGMPLPMPPVTFVASILETCGLQPKEIPAGGFMAFLRTLDSDQPELRPSAASKRERSSGVS